MLILINGPIMSTLLINKNRVISEYLIYLLEREYKRNKDQEIEQLERQRNRKGQLIFCPNTSK